MVLTLANACAVHKEEQHLMQVPQCYIHFSLNKKVLCVDMK